MMPTQSRNDFISSFETKTSDRVKGLYPETSPAALIVRLAQNNVNNMISDAGVKSQITFDDVYWGDDGRKIRIKFRAGTVTEQMTVVVLPILRLLRLL